jgi:hypothetical protein
VASLHTFSLACFAVLLATHAVRWGLAYHGWTMLYDTVGHFWRFWMNRYSPMEMIVDGVGITCFYLTLLSRLDTNGNTNTSFCSPMVKVIFGLLMIQRLARRAFRLLLFI